MFLYFLLFLNLMVKKKRVSFWATKKVPRRVNVRFRRADGKIISFKATKNVPIRKKVSFLAKRRKRRW